MRTPSSFVRFAAQSALAVACIAASVACPVAAHAGSAEATTAVHSYYERLRSQLRWVTVRVGQREVQTPDPGSRLLLTRAAAERAGLAEVGLDWRDVYGVISAETSWVPRAGMGRNGVTSEGLAQLEPATARALGVRNVNDPVEAVHAAARLLKEAGQWSARRIDGLRLAGAERAARLREGISIYYNLSSAARERWNGVSHPDLPVETQRHIENVRAGARQAERLAGGKLELPALPKATVQRVSTSPEAPSVVGTIEWSGSGSDADGRRSGKHVVWSNGSVTRESGGRVRWTSSTPSGPGDS
ncbi:lytic transglycosylase domain-containing protein [Ramlibacter alkalitolerans]|uniref:Lytic transglycosylase domain-containing protein n=1 Tax=Ramlibacter alkalitolerans TaxID=2039631 RepID=A0ABS1JLQ7_9BURK|nr:lytic transglycosylase domain-containing protein [Ramlibacter alkalitolerans]MBL0425157.1 lytic transglycosylase domain-containing protein [Ramlibacter alkalitolerans]